MKVFLRILLILLLVVVLAFGGLLGMLVAVPIAALLKIQFDKYIAKKEAERSAPQPE